MKDVYVAEVSANTIAKLFGVTVSMVTRLKSQGVITASAENKYELGPTVHNYIQHLKRGNQEPEQGTVKATQEQEDAWLASIRREKAEIELELLKGNLHKADHIALMVGNMISAAKQKLNALPTKVAPKLVGVDTTADIRAIIESEVYEALSELSEFDPEKELEKLISYVEVEDEYADA
jgi:hypothetical protein